MATWAVPSAAVAASALLVLGPVLGGGYVLRYDMVFAPRMPIGAASFGLGSQLPRAVPSDLVVAALTRVVPGWVVQDVVLAALLLAAGFGAARLAAPAAAPRTAAALAYLWTPYLGERLLLGQWAVLVGWALLPWVVRAARDVRRAPPGTAGGAWARLVFTTGVQCLGGLPAWTLALIVVPVALGWDGELPARVRAVRVGAGLGALAVYALPWALPALLRPHGAVADPAGAEVFRPASDIPFGTVLSVFTGGGIWNAQTVPPGRDAVIPALGAVAMLGIGVAGVWRARHDAVVAPLTVSAVIGLGLAVATSWPAGARAAGRFPFAAGLRDSQRLLAPWVLLLALGLAALAAALAGDRARNRRAAAGMLAVLPVAVLPALAWGVSGRLAPVDYPTGFGRLRAAVAADPVPGAVVAVPFAAYRRFPWNDDRVSLDPLARWLPRPVIAAASLPVRIGERTVLVRGEDRLAARVGAVLAGRYGPHVARELGRLGVRWVVADAPIGGRLRAELGTGAAASVGYRDRYLTAYRIPAGEIDSAAARDVYRGYAPAGAGAAAVVGADVLAAVVLVGSGLWTAPAVRRTWLASTR